MAKTRRNGPERLRRYLSGTQQTKSEVAKSLGMSAGQLRHIEIAGRPPTLPQACAIEDEIGIPIRAWL